jgi:signal transduction histidine kinase
MNREASTEATTEPATGAPPSAPHATAASTPASAPRTFEEFVADPARVAGVMNEVYTFGDRMMVRLILLHGAIAVALAAFYQTWTLSLVVSGAAIGMFLLSVTLLPRHRTTRVIAGIVLQVFVALHIYQMHGLPEMHFFFFTAFTAMVVYQDGLAMWPGTALIIAQHTLFAVLQNAGTNLYFSEDPYIGVRKLCFHFGIAILQVALCNVWAYNLRRRALRDAFQREGLLRSQAEGDARRRAEDAARAKGEFLATMSHEMRTPLNGIMGMGELLARTPLAPRQAEHLEMMRTCADNLLALVNDVLDLSKIEAGRLEIERRPFEVRAMVDDVLTMNAARAHAKGVDLVAVVERGVPESVAGDVTRVRQTLTNLVSNAVKFTSSGEIEVRVALAKPAAADAKEVQLSFAVRDTGIGIDEATRARLFQPFAQADSSIARRFGGSGLGLAICKRLVEAMGGAIGVESRVGRGSIFHFDLPCDVGAPAPRLEAARGQPALVVSRHTATREAVAELLAAHGMEVSTAASATDAARAPACRVAVVDCALPAGDLAAIGERVGYANTVLLVRADAAAPAWAEIELPWPVRGAMLDTAVLRALDPSHEPPRKASRGLSWRCPEGTRALLVEDNPVNQAVALAVLEDVGSRWTSRRTAWRRSSGSSRRATTWC